LSIETSKITAMAHRQVETTSIHSSTYHTGWIRISPDSPWEIVAHNNSGNDASAIAVGETVLPCTYLDLATQMHMQSSATKRSLIRWNRNVHFHENLKLHVPSSEKGILVLFEGRKIVLVWIDCVCYNIKKMLYPIPECCHLLFCTPAMASEGVAVALSSQPDYVRGGTVEVIFGAMGNTKTSIMKRSNKPNSNSTQHQPSSPVSQVSTPCQVCHEGTWTSFWVGMWKGKVFAGIGNAPGQKCLAILDPAAFNHDKMPGEEGDAAMEKSKGGVADDLVIVKDDNPNPAAGESTGETANGNAEIRHVGIGNAAQHGRAVKIRNLQVTQVPSFVAQLLESFPDTVDALMDHDEIDDEALKVYQEQCRKARARAEKFGIPYKEPDLEAVVPWSQARRLRANPQKGFITGIDVTDPEELAKQNARMSRFGAAGTKRELETADNEEQGDVNGKDPEATHRMEDNHDDEAIPVIQAWDNEELVRFQRADPPPSLWVTPPAGETEHEEPVDEFAMETDRPVLAPEKIHLFSIDWSAFKQIRSEDLMVGILGFAGNGIWYCCHASLSLTNSFFRCFRLTLQSTGRRMSNGWVTWAAIFILRISFRPFVL
jgi:Farnesoic acid 0-methyl transferase